jgi:uncharacterized Rmd1/YagE family protein
MRCASYCLAATFDVPQLFNALSNQYKSAIYRDVIHAAIPTQSGLGHGFYFPYGTVVFWGLSQEAENIFLKDVREFALQPLDSVESDTFMYQISDTPKVSRDEIFLPNLEVLTLLAVSHGLAQSVKLSAFESAIQKTYNATKYIPEALATQGKTLLSHREIRRKMGELFIERSSINLQFDVLDTPEFFWEYPELEPYYTMIANYLDIKRRVEVLNQRLDIVHELFDMLNNELNHKHSSRLELTIILLILIEVAITFSRDVFQWI